MVDAPGDAVVKRRCCLGEQVGAPGAASLLLVAIAAAVAVGSEAFPKGRPRDWSTPDEARARGVAHRHRGHAFGR